MVLKKLMLRSESRPSSGGTMRQWASLAAIKLAANAELINGLLQKTKHDVDSRLNVVKNKKEIDPGLAQYIDYVLEQSINDLIPEIEAMIQECKYFFAQADKIQRPFVFVLLSSLIQINNARNIAETPQEQSNLIDFAEKKGINSYQSVLFQMGECIKPKKASNNVCRICECEVKHNEFARHSLACRNIHVARHKLNSNTKKIKALMTETNLTQQQRQSINAILEIYTPTSLSAMAMISKLIKDPLVIQYKELLQLRLKIISDGRDNAIVAYKTQITLPMVDPKKDIIPDLPEPAHTINDFETLRPLASGAFGCVYLVQKKSTGDLFAIKSMPKADISSKNRFAQALIERESMAIAMSPHVVRLFYTFQIYDSLLLVMEFMPGGDLFSLLDVTGCLEEETAKFYGSEIANAIMALHEKGIIHCDLKPNNLLIGEDGHIKLTDFGLSKMAFIGQAITGISAMSAQKSVANLKLDENESFNVESASAPGTPNYLAPEVILNGKIGPAADWWSFGAILYEFIEGVPPFEGETVMELFDNIINCNYEWTVEVSDELRDLVGGLLQVNPSQRYKKEQVINHPFFTGLFTEHVPYAPRVEGKSEFTHATDVKRPLGTIKSDSYHRLAPKKASKENYFELWDGANYYALHDLNMSLLEKEKATQSDQ